jgi:hypothetical protein
VYLIANFVFVVVVVEAKHVKPVVPLVLEEVSFEVLYGMVISLAEDFVQALALF